MNVIVYYLSFVLQIVFLALGTYYFTVSLFCWFNRRTNIIENPKTHSFALVVAAHNEEMVIENMVESLKNLNYPKESYDIFVIADNCTDSTARLAREKGALVFERFDEKRGKGYALEWMFNQIFEMDKKYDVISIFDADNIVSHSFLTETNKQLNLGYKVVQGYIDSKNPFDSWISAAYSISFWCINKLFQKARYNLNLSCQLCGTGFTVNTDLLKEIGWGATCLTEDIEFTMKLSLNNIKVGWANDAIVYDEKPLTLSQSWKQRIRWMQGHADVASRFFFPLIKQAIKEKSFSKLDCAIYLIQPLRIIAMGIITLMAWLQTIYADGNFGFFQVWYLFKDFPAIWAGFVVAQFFYMPFVLYMERRFNKKTLMSCVTFIFYSLTWVPIAVLGILNKDKKVWFHTQHTRKITIEELEKV